MEIFHSVHLNLTALAWNAVCITRWHTPIQPFALVSEAHCTPFFSSRHFTVSHNSIAFKIVNYYYCYSYCYYRCANAEFLILVSSHLAVFLFVRLYFFGFQEILVGILIDHTRTAIPIWSDRQRFFFTEHTISLGPLSAYTPCDMNDDGDTSIVILVTESPLDEAFSQMVMCVGVVADAFRT